MSGGVRDLRAMFENKEPSSSSPDRGRSPAGSIGPNSEGTSLRPLSKVRTSFVAVGGNGGQLGLHRENSDAGGLVKRRSSFSGEDESHHKLAEVKGTIAEELLARKQSALITEPIPEMAVETPAGEPNKQLGETGKTELKDGSKAAPTKKLEKRSTGTSRPTAGQMNGTTKAVMAKSGEKDAKTVPRPARITTTATSTTSKKSPNKVVPKTPTSPLKGPLEHVKTPDKTPVKKSSREMTIVTKPASKAEIKTARPAKKSPPHSGFHKPAPRPPTIPVQLPASLTAHTTSSGSKSSSSAPPHRQSLSGASGNVQPTNPLQASTAQARSPSRASQSNHAISKPLGRSQSTLHRSNPRPSFGPPPARRQPPRQSLPQSAAPADDTFLARMMRPTTSSASKTAEKTQVTPPKKAQTLKRPTTKDGPPKMQDLGKSDAVHKTAKPSHSENAPVTNKPLASSTLTSQPVKKTQLEPKPSQQLPHVMKKDSITSSEKPEVVEKALEEDQPASTTDLPEAVPSEATPASIQETDAEEAKSTPVKIATQPPAAISPISITIARDVDSPASPAQEVLPSPIQQSVITTESTEPMDKTSPNPTQPDDIQDISTDLERVQNMADSIPDEKRGMPETESNPSKVEDIATIDEQSQEVKQPQPKTDPAEDSEDLKAKSEIVALNAALVGAGETEVAHAESAAV